MTLLIFSRTSWTYVFLLKVCSGYFLKQNTCWSAATSFISGKTAPLETCCCTWMSGNILLLCICHARVYCLPNRMTIRHNTLFRRMFFLNTWNSVMSEFILFIMLHYRQISFISLFISQSKWKVSSLQDHWQRHVHSELASNKKFQLSSANKTC